MLHTLSESTLPTRTTVFSNSLTRSENSMRLPNLAWKPPGIIRFMLTCTKQDKLFMHSDDLRELCRQLFFVVDMASDLKSKIIALRFFPNTRNFFLIPSANRPSNCLQLTPLPKKCCQSTILSAFCLLRRIPRSSFANIWSS